nr:unnamed protein product [Digitaria exilis]
MRVPKNTRINHPPKPSRERPADRNPSAAIRHAEPMPRVLRRRLRSRPDVPRLTVVVLVENPEQVRDHERRVVVREHQPPRGRPEGGVSVVVVFLGVEGGDELAGDAGDADGGGEAAGVGVGEAGGVGGDAEVDPVWERPRHRRRRWCVEEDEAVWGGGGWGGGVEPEAEEREAEREAERELPAGGGDAEHHVAEGGWWRWHGWRGGGGGGGIGVRRRVRGRRRRGWVEDVGEERWGERGGGAVEEVVGDGDEEGEEGERDEDRAERDAVGWGRHGRRRRGFAGWDGKWEAAKWRGGKETNRPEGKGREIVVE